MKWAGRTQSNRRFRNKNNLSRKVNSDLLSKYIKNKTKQEALALIDEVINVATFKNSARSNYSHGMLDNYGKNDWEYWKVIIQEKNKSVWEATLNIANTANGEKILYDIFPIKKIAGQVVKSTTSSANNNITHSSQNVNTNNSNAATREQTWTKDAKKLQAVKEQNAEYRRVNAALQKLINKQQAQLKAIAETTKFKDRRIIKDKSMDLRVQTEYVNKKKWKLPHAGICSSRCLYVRNASR